MAMSGNWADLRIRVFSAIVMVGVGGVAIWLGGVWFQAFAVLCTALMTWELVRMTGPTEPAKPFIAAVLVAVLMGLAILPGGLDVWLLFLVGAGSVHLQSTNLRWQAGLYALGLQFAVWQIVTMRDVSGLDVVLWLVLVVIASDVMGYFAGRLIGGAKFWPKVSPKKTWSGTVAGWFGAALVGVCFVIWAGMPGWVIALSVFTAFAAQMGDIAESALKRAAGVKDSSNLIPGHGGFLDRFDALIGAAAFLFVVDLIQSGFAT